MKSLRIQALFLLFALFATSLPSQDARAESSFTGCPDQWTTQLEPLTISSNFPQIVSTWVGTVNPMLAEKFLDDYFYINYPQSSYRMKVNNYELREIPGKPKSVIEFASSPLAQKIKSLGSDIAIFERWESSKDGVNFEQLPREEGGATYDRLLESAISSDHYLAEFAVNAAGFSVSSYSLGLDGLIPGMNLRFSFEVRVRGCDKPGVFSTNAVTIPNQKQRISLGYEGIKAVNSIYGFPAVSFVLEERCSSYLKNILRIYAENLNDKYPFVPWRQSALSQPEGCGYLGFSQGMTMSWIARGLEPIGCLSGDGNYSFKLSRVPCRVGLSVSLPLYLDMGSQFQPRPAGTFSILVDEVNISKSIPENFEISLPEELDVNASYGDVLNDIKFYVEKEQAFWSKSVGMIDGEKTISGSYFEVRPQEVCLVEPRNEAEKNMGSGLLKTKVEGACTVTIFFSGNINYLPATFSKSFSVVDFKAKAEAEAKAKAEAEAEAKAKADAEAKAIKKSITCSKGKKVKVISGVKPKCPKGFKKAA